MLVKISKKKFWSSGIAPYYKSTGVTPVSLDALGSVLQYSAAATKTYTGITVGSGSNRALVCMIGGDVSAGLEPVTMVWDSGASNQSMTQIAAIGDGVNSIRVILFGLVNPASGNKTLAVTMNTAVSGYLAGISFNNVLQTGGTATFNNPQTVSSGGVSPVALTTTGVSADASVAALMCASGVNRTATTATSWFANNSGPSGNSYGDYRLGVGTISDTLSGGMNAVMAATTVKAG